MFGKPLIYMILLFSLFLTPFVASGMERGDPAPDFRLEALDGQEYALSDFKGRIVLLKLATTWCPTCKQLTNTIEELGPYLAEKDAVFLHVYVQDTAKMVRKYLKHRNFAMESHGLLDDGQAHGSYSVYLIPRLLIIDRDMRVFYDSAGQDVSGAKIKQVIEKLEAASQAETDS